MTASSSVRLRRAMVASLEASGAIRSEPVRDAFLAVPREHFVPELAKRDGLAAIYRPDVALTTATDNRGVAISSSSAPAIMAPMLEALQLDPGHRVLEIGAGPATTPRWSSPSSGPWPGNDGRPRGGLRAAARQSSRPRLIEPVPQKREAQHTQ